ncbi:MAG: efflux RND transporter periplasmic adaptor subunit [Sphingobacteriia bacterium]|nr:MAG: efflux RND transporter periplasmic adaptor subunit [Sphingobacteriia bacterium]TAG30805.1 MAG: efflux RND transporter periplasmic adaptor subunit [Sphingobacteriia bacterium]
MKTILQSLFIGTTLLVFISCGSNSEKNNPLADKKNALEKLKTQQNTLTNQIKNLESEIAKLDTSSSNSVAKLVGISAVTAQYFAHYIDLQGNVTSDNISYVSPRMGPGQVRSIFIKKGDMVKQGQLLIKLDDAVMKQSVIAAQKSLETLKTQLSFAKDIYQRQNNLWKEGIGTEVQLISAKNNVQSLERQIAAGEEQIKVAEEQLRATNVTADVAGVVDELNVRVGEIFAGIAGVMPQIKIVNTAAMKVTTEIPENYSSKIKQGSKVIINLPDINKVFNSSVATASRSINANNRSFEVEVKIPYDANIRPNQLAQIKFLDYEATNAIAVNINTVQTDEKGKYVYIAVANGNKLMARKKMIVVGEVNGQLIEIKSGLNAGDQLITEGYQNIYEGQLLTVLAK